MTYPTPMIRITATSTQSDGQTIAVSAEVPGPLDERHMSSLATLLVDCLFGDDDDGDDTVAVFTPRHPVNRN